VARNIIAPSEMAVGAVTAFSGAPFFVYLVRARYRSLP
jgi:ABC-type Fe3+-siderophore transport system permease subunit